LGEGCETAAAEDMRDEGDEEGTSVTADGLEAIREINMKPSVSSFI
jgi:hypothetical protein